MLARVWVVWDATAAMDADGNVSSEASVICDKSSHTSTPVKPDKGSCTPGKLDLSPSTALIPPASTPVAAGDHLSIALLAQRLPPLPKFTGDNVEEDTYNIDEWLEQMELVAQGTSRLSSSVWWHSSVDLHLDFVVCACPSSDQVTHNSQQLYGKGSPQYRFSLCKVVTFI